MDSLYYGQTEYRMLNAEGNGAGMTSKMIDHLNSLENVTVMLETTGTGLITNQANEVIGATAEGKDGSMVIYADNVVLATSGFAANKEMLELYTLKYSPDGEIRFLAADPDAKVRGIGTMLLNELEQREKGKEIYLFTDNQCTYQFYEHRGFERINEKDIAVSYTHLTLPTILRV